MASWVMFSVLACGCWPPGDEVTLDEAVRRFHAEYGRPGARDEDRIRAVTALAVHRDAKVVQALVPLLTQAPVPVRIVVARRLGEFRGVAGAEEGLREALRHPRNNGTSARGVQITILQSLGALQAAGAAETVNRFIESPDVWVAKAAVEAAGRIRSASSVDRMIKMLVRLDGPSGDLEIALDLFGGELPAMGMRQVIRREAEEAEKLRKSRREVLREPLLRSLAALTGMHFTGAREWQVWWRTRKRDFVVPS